MKINETAQLDEARIKQVAAIRDLEVQALCEIAQLVGSAAHLRTALSEILRVLHDTMQMERATLYLLDDSGKNLRIAASCGMTNAEQNRGVYSINEGVCGKIIRSRYPFVVPDIRKEPLFLNRTRSRDGLGEEKISFIGVPVILRNRPVGVLTVDRLFQSEFSFEEDIHFITVVATLVAQFLELDRVLKEKEEVLLQENLTLKGELGKHYRRHKIIGQSKVMDEVFTLIERVAPSRATALLLGESGTGKELVARAIHQASPRSHNSFIKVNCAALPENLLESELLGHEKGAFTGATLSKVGRFEVANGGTLFLDEIGELPLNLQAKLLRVLQEKQFERLGGTRTITVDVRIVAATNVDLEKAVAQGRFRADLYYRLNVVPVILPPLRERKGDVPLLVDFFLRESNKRNNKDLRMTSEMLDAFVAYSWPGNVRELQNLVERLVIMSSGGRAKMSDLPSYMLATPISTPRPPEIIEEAAAAERGKDKLSLEEIECGVVRAALVRNGWVQARAARELGLTQRQIGYRIKKYGLREDRQPPVFD